jgi:hypothetical protein
MFQGRIYKITSLQTEKIYIGSTTTALNKRLSKHKSGYKRYQNGKYRNTSSFEIIKYPDAIIELIEEKEFKDKKEMLFRERHYIEIYECVNKVIPIRTNEEQHNYNKEYNKKYKMDNKDKINAGQNEKCICECGHSYTRYHKASHMRTKKHMKNERVINITFNMTINESEVKIINGSDVKG